MASDPMVRAAIGAKLVGLRDSANALLDGPHDETAWRKFARRVLHVLDIPELVDAGVRGVVPAPQEGPPKTPTLP